MGLAWWRRYGVGSSDKLSHRVIAAESLASHSLCLASLPLGFLFFFSFVFPFGDWSLRCRCRCRVYIFELTLFFSFSLSFFFFFFVVVVYMWAGRLSFGRLSLHVSWPAWLKLMPMVYKFGGPS